MKITVLLFAAAREIAGAESVELDLPLEASVADARAALLLSLPGLALRTNALLWAVNNEYAADDRILHSTDVVACFPPVSGG
ncbi:MAG: MoaD/ThiS family protein [Planctomycetaceae bacterium]|jgi:molybdopterin converting factor subunit 1|nr:MoaD/ThiS family protein [Planctomycetaceae bacterium]